MGEGTDQVGVYDDAGWLPEQTVEVIGRDQLVAVARDRLREAREPGNLSNEVRVLTMTGPAGVGKSTVALSVARGVREHYRDGVWWVPLAAQMDPKGLPAVLVEALGVRDQSERAGQDTLIRHLRDKEALLVLDNCEHLVAEVSRLVGTLINAAPNLTVLTTSRELLGIRGEYLLGVAPLAVPPEDHHILSLPALREIESVRVLCNRARAIAPHFQLTEANRDQVVELLRRVDGLPLAVVLAGGQLRTLSVREIVERLDRIFAVLTNDGQFVPSNHDTLWAVVDSSHQNCTNEERSVWAQTSVFADGFTLAAAEAVCSGDGIDSDGVLHLLGGLVDKSVLIREDTPTGRTRFRLLETMRQYGAQRLHALGAVDAVRQRHLDYYQCLVTRGAESWFGPGEVELLNELGAEAPNLRRALQYAEDNNPLQGLQLAVDVVRVRLCFFWGPLREAHDWLLRLADAAATAHPDLPPQQREAAHALASWILVCMGGAERAYHLVDIDRPARPDRPELAFAQGALLFLGKSDPRSTDLLWMAYRGLKAAGRHEDAHMALLILSMDISFLGADAEEAMRVARMCLADAETAGAPWAISWAQWIVGLAELAHGSPRCAVTTFRAALRRQTRMERPRWGTWGTIWSVHGVAWAMATRGDIDSAQYAALLLGICERLREQTSVEIGGMAPFIDRHRAAEDMVKSTLGDQHYRRAYRMGLDVPLDRAWAIALGEAATPRLPEQDEGIPALTPAQWRIVALVGEGLESKDIAKRLDVSRKTVDNQIQSIYTRLGWRGRGNRARLATWATEHADWVNQGAGPRP